MKAVEITSHLAVGLGVPTADINEIIRVATAQAAELDEDIDALRAAGLESLRLLTRRGPRSSVEVNANLLGFLVIGHLCTGRRADIPRKALDMASAIYDRSENPKQQKCPVTGQLLFAPAVAALLTHRPMFDAVKMIRVSSDAGFAVLEFNDDTSSWFFRIGVQGLPLSYSVRHLHPSKASFLFDLVNSAA